MDRELTTMKDETQHPGFNRYRTLPEKPAKEPDNTIIRTGSVFDKKKGKGDAAFPYEHPCPRYFIHTPYTRGVSQPDPA